MYIFDLCGYEQTITGKGFWIPKSKSYYPSLEHTPNFFIGIKKYLSKNRWNIFASSTIPFSVEKWMNEFQNTLLSEFFLENRLKDKHSKHAKIYLTPIKVPTGILEEFSAIWHFKRSYCRTIVRSLTSRNSNGPGFIGKEIVKTKLRFQWWILWTG
jgi:hypothetical protein